MALDLPRDLAKGDVTRTANTPTEYWSLFYRGFVPQEGPATADVAYEDLTPAQKAARTRALHKAQEQEQTSQEGATDTAGTNGTPDSTDNA